MSKTFEELILTIQEEDRPIMTYQEISYFMIDKLKKGELSLYEAYTLNGEMLNLKRKSYTQIAWKRTPGIRDCIAFINQILLAILFDEIEYSEKLKELALEAYKLYTKRSGHYIMDNFERYLDIANNEELLKEVADTRIKYDIALERELAGEEVTEEQLKEFDYDDGPFLTEVFPYGFFEPENLILSKETFIVDKKLSKEVENIVIEVAIKW